MVGRWPPQGRACLLAVDFALHGQTGVLYVFGKGRDGGVESIDLLQTAYCVYLSVHCFCTVQRVYTLYHSTANAAGAAGVHLVSRYGKRGERSGCTLCIMVQQTR